MSLLAEQCPFWLAGSLLGLLVVAMRWAGNLHLGALGSFVAAQSWARRPATEPGWRVLFLAGMVGGGLLYGLVVGDQVVTFAHGSFDAMFGGGLLVKALILGGSGLLIGFGARTAGGCTSGHGVCGVSQLSPGSVVATGTFVATAVLVANLLPRLLAVPK